MAVGPSIMMPLIDHRARLRRAIALLAACCVLALTAGCVVSGPTRSGSARTGSAQGKENTATAKKNFDALSKNIRSYAIVDAKRSPRLNVHLFGLPGANSLSNVTEKTLLRTIGSAGGFGGHKAFSPVLAPPSQRWEPTAFGPATTSAKAAAGTGDSRDAGGAGTGDSGAVNGADSVDDVVDISNRIVAAGGNFLISSLTTQAPTKKTTVVLTDLAQDTTVHAQEMFSSQVDPAEVSVDDSGELIADGAPINPTDLTRLGTRVVQALRTPLALPEDADVRDPDYSCALLPCVALTYDDGPGEPTVEERLLMKAESAAVRLTYFLVGKRVAADTETVKRISAAGHEIANHTFSHPRLDHSDPGRVQNEVTKTDRILEAAVTKAPQLIRPPFGALDKSAADSLGRPAIIWDVDTGDWKHKDATRTIAAVRNNAEPGSIVLMHSIHPTTVDAAAGVFRVVADKGLYAVTVSSLFEGIRFEKGGSYFCRGYSDELCSNPEHPAVHKV